MDTKALVTLCQKGNGQALSLLYENYSEKMLKVCLRYIPDPTIAQDLLHDGFVIIFTSIHSLRNPEKLEYWMKKIMRNLALQYLNHANANPTIPLTDIPEEEEPAENPFCPDFPWRLFLEQEVGNQRCLEETACTKWSSALAHCWHDSPNRYIQKIIVKIYMLL